LFLYIVHDTNIRLYFYIASDISKKRTILNKKARHQAGLQVLRRGEIVFPDAAHGAHPICGKVFKSGSGGDAVVGISCLRVVLVPANVAYVLFHTERFLLLVLQGKDNHYSFLAKRFLFLCHDRNHKSI
jgi:hypothetical protein